MSDAVEADGLLKHRTVLLLDAEAIAYVLRLPEGMQILGLEYDATEAVLRVHATSPDIPEGGDVAWTHWAARDPEGRVVYTNLPRFYRAAASRGEEER